MARERAKLSHSSANQDAQGATAGYEAELWGMADALRGSMDAAEYKHVVIPVISSSGLTDYHSESKVQGPGVVTGRYGTLGQVFFIPNNFWPLNTT